MVMREHRAEKATWVKEIYKVPNVKGEFGTYEDAYQAGVDMATHSDCIHSFQVNKAYRLATPDEIAAEVEGVMSVAEAYRQESLEFREPIVVEYHWERREDEDGLTVDWYRADDGTRISVTRTEGHVTDVRLVK